METITSERIKWMSSLRDEFSAYFSIVDQIDRKVFRDKDVFELNDKLVAGNAKIKLLLNHKGTRDKSLSFLVDQIKISANKMAQVIDSIKSTQTNQYVANLILPEAKEIDEARHADYLDMLDLSNCDALVSKLIQDDLMILINNGVFMSEMSIDKINTDIQVEQYYRDEDFFQNRNYKQEEKRLKNLLFKHKVLIHICINIITTQLQGYLKDEWERVKDESELGNLIYTVENRVWKNFSDMKRFNEVRNWIILKGWHDRPLLNKIAIILSISAIVLAFLSLILI
ncbi:hypothetical protein LJR153_007388 [Paenibacillus sp. LjRoot153]